MSKQFSILEKVAGIRQILSVAKSVQEKRPDATVAQVVEAIELALIIKLKRLADKPFASLTPAQILSLEALRVGKAVMPSVLELLGDEETTRELNADERLMFAELHAKAAEKRSAAAALRKAKEGTPAAKAAVTALKKQLALADV